MNRRDLVKLAAVQTAAMALPAAMMAAEGKTGRGAEAKAGSGSATTLKNAQLELTLSAASGLQCKLVHVPSGRVLADGAYSYSFGTPTFSGIKRDGASVVLRKQKPASESSIASPLIPPPLGSKKR